LNAFNYPSERTIEKVLAMAIAADLKPDLVHVLATGTVP
jgi:hypothetical protein